MRIETWKDGELVEVTEIPDLPLTAEERQAMRLAAYRDESDPIFFKALRGEATQQDWLDKVAEIKARWPQ